MASERQQHFLDLIAGRRRGTRAAIERGLLRGASWGYRAAIWARNRSYDRGWLRVESVPVPVVSVGNLTLGGTGKTPCVEYLGRHFGQEGRRAAILSRGYGSGSGPNDEALVLEENLPDVPHLQSPDRVAIARIAIEELESEVLILDDGFQHRRLARNLDIVLIDATCPWGHGRLLPRGLLREPVSSLRRAGAVVITRCDLVSAEVIHSIRARIATLAPSAAIAHAVHRPLCWVNNAGDVREIGHFSGARAAAFCGIGNPDSFHEMLRQMNVDCMNWRAFPDHYGYRREDVEALESWGGGEVILTTQKDLVKLRVATLGSRPLWALKIGLAFIDGEDRFRQLLDAVTA